MGPIAVKSRIMLPEGNLRANMYIFKLATENPEESSAIILCEEGDLGLYNRANRGLYNFIESCLPVIVAAPLTSFVYTLPTFILIVIYSFGRILYQTGYTKHGFGGHFPGFFLERLGMSALAGLLFVSTLKTF